MPETLITGIHTERPPRERWYLSLTTRDGRQVPGIRTRNNTMLTVIASTKTQIAALLSGTAHSQPSLLDRAAILVKHLQELKGDDLEQLLGISSKLAEQARQRYGRFHLPHEPDSAGSVLLSFTGEVFAAMEPQRFTIEEQHFANQHLRVLSGLYGILQPFDLMQPYRLEMATRLSVGAVANLYRYWQEAVTAALNKDLVKHAEKVVVNCASSEYSRVIDLKHLAADLITITCRQRVNGTLKTIPIHAKRARGLFVRWLITNRIDTRAQLNQFDSYGYRFAEQLSSDNELVFVTDQP